MIRPLLRSVVLALVLATAGCTMMGYPAMGAPPAGPVAGIGEAGERGAGEPSAGERDGSAPGAEGREAGRSTARAEGGPRADDGSWRREPLSPSGNPDSYEVAGRRYHVMESADGHEETGLASWYGGAFDGRSTSSGEIFDSRLLTAAHRTLPLPSWVEVENLHNGRTVVVRVNDRGPFADPDERVLDVSEAAARELGMIGAGVARVRIRVLAAPRPSG